MVKKLEQLEMAWLRIYTRSLFDWASPTQKQHVQSRFHEIIDYRGIQDALAHLLAYVTGTISQKLLLRNEYLTAENRILRGQIKGTSQGRAGNRTLGRADGEGKSQRYRRGSGSRSAHILRV